MRLPPRVSQLAQTLGGSARQSSGVSPDEASGTATPYEGAYPCESLIYRKPMNEYDIVKKLSCEIQLRGLVVG